MGPDLEYGKNDLLVLKRTEAVVWCRACRATNGKHEENCLACGHALHGGPMPDVTSEASIVSADSSSRADQSELSVNHGAVSWSSLMEECGGVSFVDDTLGVEGGEHSGLRRWTFPSPQRREASSVG